MTIDAGPATNGSPAGRPGHQVSEWSAMDPAHSSAPMPSASPPSAAPIGPASMRSEPRRRCIATAITVRAAPVSRGQVKPTCACDPKPLRSSTRPEVV